MPRFCRSGTTAMGARPTPAGVWPAPMVIGLKLMCPTMVSFSVATREMNGCAACRRVSTISASFGLPNARSLTSRTARQSSDVSSRTVNTIANPHYALGDVPASQPSTTRPCALTLNGWH